MSSTFPRYRVQATREIFADIRAECSNKWNSLKWGPRGSCVIGETLRADQSPSSWKFHGASIKKLLKLWKTWKVKKPVYHCCCISLSGCMYGRHTPQSHEFLRVAGDKILEEPPLRRECIIKQLITTVRTLPPPPSRTVVQLVLELFRCRPC